MKNVGNIDRIIRVFLGLVILILFGLMGSWWSLIGLVLILTGIIKICPAYFLFKIDTTKYDEIKSKDSQ
ncbi:MAG TPA: DUF2892 domain-containing protein [Ignavibacteriales bacterium]|jgi:hypothetical protein|nr:DUF2892 domain-containing protein [Ignavibacteriales bacterium]